MLTQIRQFFAAPFFEDEEKARVANLLNVILNAMLGFTLVMTVVFTIVDEANFWSDLNNALIIGSLLIAILVMRFLLRHGDLQFVGSLLSFALWAAATFSNYSFSGIRNSVTSAYLLCIIIAGLLLGGRAALIFTGLSLAGLLGVWYVEASGTMAYVISASSLTFDVTAYSGIFIIGGLLLRYAAASVARSLELARRNEHAQIEANRELNKLRESLEHQVAERTRDLERRTTYLEASAQVSQAAASILDADQLVQQVVELIRERFDMYYVGLFLVSKTGEQAMLRAGTGEAGQAMLARGYWLPVGSDSTVGWSIANGRPRVAQEAGENTARTDAEDLPDTRSEAALPLRLRGRVIGALTVQSARPDVFDEMAVAVLQGLADQIAVALDNARLFAESQTALEAERRAYGQLGREAWRQMLRAGLTPGFSYVSQQVVPIGDEWTPEMDAALRMDKSVVVANQARPALALPVKVRGQTIGVVDLSKGDSHDTWTTEEVRLIETLTEQLGAALESARLYQDTQRRAAREETINTVTANLRAVPTVNAILKRTVEELGRTFRASRTAVTLEIPRGDGQSQSR
jgi:GAF domain-containing protein